MNLGYTKTKLCPKCGGPLIEGYNYNEQGEKLWECHNDQCDLNRDGLKQVEVLANIKALIYILFTLTKWAFIVGVIYLIAWWASHG